VGRSDDGARPALSFVPRDEFTTYSVTTQYVVPRRPASTTYWGADSCCAASSENLVHWVPLEFDAGANRYLTRTSDATIGSWENHRVPGRRALRPILLPRPGRFDSILVEPGPPAVLTADGIVLIYDGAQLMFDEDGTPTGAAYQPGRVLFDGREPGSPTARSVSAFLDHTQAGELSGQVDDVCFAQGSFSTTAPDFSMTAWPTHGSGTPPHRCEVHEGHSDAGDTGRGRPAPAARQSPTSHKRPIVSAQTSRHWIGVSNGNAPRPWPRRSLAPRARVLR
jgi:hypothetical protein